MISQMLTREVACFCSGYVIFVLAIWQARIAYKVFQAADIFVRLQLCCELMDLFWADKLRQTILKPVAG